MKILMLSGTHPEKPHISGIRAARFAAGLARSGHHCVLICPALRAEDLPQQEQGERLQSHDWRRPFIAPVDEPPPDPSARGYPGSLGTAVKMLIFGGVRTAFARAAQQKAEALFDVFKPDVIWATFGSLEAIYVARRFSNRHGIPWIFDVKDNVEIYLPKKLRGLLARRVRGFQALVSNSDLHGQAAERWLGSPAETIYSGVDECFFEPRRPITPDTGPYVTIVGGLYHREMVESFVDGVARHNRGGAGEPVTIVHIGAEFQLLRSIAAPYGSIVPVIEAGYIAPAEMARICYSALANAYIFFGRGFHHKLFELLACGRPVIAFGGELPESIAQAARLNTRLETPTDAGALAALLATLPIAAADDRPCAQFFTWPQQAAILERTMKRLVDHG